MALSNVQITQAIPRDKEYKLSDGGGLYLLIRPNGSKLWKHKLRINGKEKKLSYGAFPLVSLKEARLKRDETKLAMSRGEDPVQQRRETKLAAMFNEANLFQDVAEEFIAKRESDGLAPATIAKNRWFLELLKADLGRRPIATIKSTELLAALKKIEDRGHRESAHRARSFASRVFRYGCFTQRCESDPAHLLKGALKVPAVKHYAAVTDPQRLGVLLDDIDNYDGYPSTRYALKILPHVFVRPGELRLARWEEFNFDKAEWLIPAGRMKNRFEHRVPLSRQVKEMLLELAELHGRRDFVFRSFHARGKTISANTTNQALRRLGFSGEEVTSHGFRTTASTLLNEAEKWFPDAVERSLSHLDANAIRRIYNQAQYWNTRIEMAQWWSDYLDELKSAAAASRLSKGK
ncbi:MULTISPECIES: tyrosine-type recombinase/integrase [Sphingopyxis]|uniref:tyrosine-type recombinase/integrase n=1 Tax=Sphingopyxis TaxID=165697 RepID=UPI001C2C0E49|nr:MULTISPECIES: integrase arm-type DNA-binding domain-containing protein [Sphingopyxis]QXF12812.1 tyrosine-type recombinase/integrase [Sphingopyxis terrae subsp. terrae]